MSLRGGFVALAALALAASCKTVGVAPNVNSGVAPDSHVGYIAGAFVDEGTSGFGYGFGLAGSSSQDTVLSFDGALISTNRPRVRLGMVEVPPGEYRVAYWLVFGALRQKVIQKDLWGSSIGSAFVVKEGHVVFLGTFAASTTKGYKKINFSIDSVPTAADQVPILVRNGYPRFAEAPLECVLCSAPPAGAKVAYAAPAMAPGQDAAAPPAPQPKASEAPPPPPAASSAAASPRTVAAKVDKPVRQGEVVLHLYRPGADYAGWGLTTWESFEGNKPRRIIASLAEPLPPSGTDGYGAYWVLKDGDYANRRVGFLLHKGNQKDVAGLDRAWFLSASREVWLNSGDPAVYFRPGDAAAARPK